LGFGLEPIRRPATEDQVRPDVEFSVYTSRPLLGFIILDSDSKQPSIQAEAWLEFVAVAIHRLQK
jgi:hypothetical protein